MKFRDLESKGFMVSKDDFRTKTNNMKTRKLVYRFDELKIGVCLFEKVNRFNKLDIGKLAITKSDDGVYILTYNESLFNSRIFIRELHNLHKRVYSKLG